MSSTEMDGTSAHEGSTYHHDKLALLPVDRPEGGLDRDLYSFELPVRGSSKKLSGANMSERDHPLQPQQRSQLASYHPQQFNFTVCHMRCSSMTLQQVLKSFSKRSDSLCACHDSWHQGLLPSPKSSAKSSNMHPCMDNCYHVWYQPHPRLIVLSHLSNVHHDPGATLVLFGQAWSSHGWQPPFQHHTRNSMGTSL